MLLFYSERFPVRRTYHRKEAVREQSADRHPDVGFAGAQSLGDREHALGTGLQPAAGQDKAQVGKSRQKP